MVKKNKIKIPNIESGTSLLGNILVLSLGVFGLIILLALLGLFIAGYVGFGFLTKPIFDAKEDDKKGTVTITLDSDQIPIKNQIILIKIFAVLVWISVAFSIINVNMGFVFKRKR